MSDLVQKFREALAKISKWPWGIMADGPYGDGKPWKAHMESAEGLTIGSSYHTEPIARLSGYLHPVEANADFFIHAPQWLSEAADEIERQTKEINGLTNALKLSEEFRQHREQCRYHPYTEKWSCEPRCKVFIEGPKETP